MMGKIRLAKKRRDSKREPSTTSGPTQQSRPRWWVISSTRQVHRELDEKERHFSLLPFLECLCAECLYVNMCVHVVRMCVCMHAEA